MFCNQCGSALTAGSQACAQCGRPVIAFPVVPSPVEASATPAQAQTIILPYDGLPPFVINQIANLSPGRQQEFFLAYSRKRKDLALAYLLSLFLGAHYAYLGKWGMQILFWLTVGGLGLWWLVDLCRLPIMVRHYNENVAVSVIYSHPLFA